MGQRLKSIFYKKRGTLPEVVRSKVVKGGTVMNGKFKYGIAALIVCSLVLAGNSAYARQYGDHGMKREVMHQKMERHMERMGEQLGLTQEQEESLAEFRKTHRQEAKTLREQIRSKRGEMREELQKEQLDMGKINQLNSEVKRLLTEAEDHRLEGVLEVRKTLTPEQVKKFGEITQKRDGPEECMERGAPRQEEESPPKE